MNSCVPPSRRIASNRLWTPRGVVCDPLVEIAPDGRVRLLGVCSRPDSLPLTEFYGGVLVPGFPAGYRDAFARLMLRRERPLEELLAELIPDGAVWDGGICGAPDGVRGERPSGGRPSGAPERTEYAPIVLPATLVLLSGLDYDPLRLTARSQILLII